MGVNQGLVVCLGDHPDHVVQDHDPFRRVQSLQLGVQPADDRGGHGLQQAVDCLRVHGQFHHQGRDPGQPGGDRHRPARADHPDRPPFGAQALVHHLVGAQDQRHQAILARVDRLGRGDPVVQVVHHRLDRRRGVGIEAHLDAEGRRLGRHPVFDPVARNPDHVGEALFQAPVDGQPLIGEEIVIPRVDPGVTRQPRAVHDQRDGHPIGFAQLRRQLKPFPVRAHAALHRMGPRAPARQRISPAYACEVVVFPLH